MAEAVSETSALRRPGLGVTASALAAFGWALAGIFANLTFANGVVISFYRSWLGAGLLVVILAVMGRRVSWALLRTSLLGGVLLCLDMTLFFSAIKLASVAVVTVIGALQPALVLVVAAPLVGEHVSKRTVAWTGVAIGGVGVIVVGAGAPTGGQALGDLLAVGALAAWTAYFVVAKRAQVRVDALGYTTGVMIVAAMTNSVLIVLLGDSVRRVALGDWIWIGLLAVVPTGAHLLMNWAHRHLDVSVSSVIGSANPIVAAVAGYLVLGQGLSALQVLGGAIGILAIGVVAARGTRSAQPPIVVADTAVGN